MKTFLRIVISITQVSFCVFSLLESIWNCIIFMSLLSCLKKNDLTNLGMSKGSGLYCIPVVVLKNCEPELSYKLPELFNMCLKESCFPDCWSVSLLVLVLKNVGERCTAKNYCPVSFLSVVSKVFGKLVNNRLVDHLDECSLLSNFQYFLTSDSCIW